ncbi:MAG: VCBS repeat-containing protein, partial [Deltaproteobacteria bacterium]|nr:VCBS repeat-containing protein [Deltaproteobacteria bacterium]
SGKISNNIKGLAVGDADGDGDLEIIFITDKKVFVYQKMDGKLKKIAEYKEKGSADFLKVDMADINRNGKNEIFVTNLRENSLSSIVLEYKDENIEKIADNLEWFLGVVNFPGEGPVLLGQTYGDNNPLKGKIYRIKWDSGNYVPSGLEEVPSGLQIFGFGVLRGEGSREKEFVNLDNDGRLYVYSQNGEEKWKSERTYGSSEVSFQVASNGSPGSKEKTVFLPMRLVIKDLNNDKKMDIILGKNFYKDKGLFNRKSICEKGSVYNLQWYGTYMDVRWHTGKLDECVVDYSIADADNDGIDELVIAVKSGRSYLTFRPKSYILIYEIS